ncbi:hypothetical protein [Sphingomonas sp.]|uniref:hypothetical protein n=1 Tax=Sphingomonas sp. TaxID=28214 RepID=UPI003F727D67
MSKFDFAAITEVTLAPGAHRTPEDGLCFMEMVAWFAGEEHSDRPKCACPVLGSYGMSVNDGLPADVRDRLLKPLVPLIAGTRGTVHDEINRASFLAMWTVNRVMPVWLRAYGIPQFDALASQCEAARSADELDAIALAALAARAALAALAARAALAALAARAARADLAALAARAARADLAALAARADLAARARDQVQELMVEGLRQAILIGPHEGFDVAIDLAARHQALREMVEA